MGRVYRPEKEDSMDKNIRYIHKRCGWVKAAAAATVMVLCISGCGKGSGDAGPAGTASAGGADDLFSSDDYSMGDIGMTDAGTISDATLSDTTDGTSSDDGANGNADGNTSAKNSEPVSVDGPDEFSLFIYDGAGNMINKGGQTFEGSWTGGTDIVSVQTFASSADSFALSATGGTPFANKWRELWNAGSKVNGADAAPSDKARIGFKVEFELMSGEKISQMLLKAGDELVYRPYLENYLYDDINQSGGWYSHLEPGQDNEKTMMTSIKFTPGEKVDEIAGSIMLTAFVYDSQDDFDSNGEYIGDISVTLEIVRK